MTAADGAALFNDDQALADALPGYRPRPGQAEMAAAVADTIDDGSRLVVEAGTGTGKTLAYLLPALASRRKTIVSTATRYLQSQLADKDVPLAQTILGRNFHVTVLKGRANYLCLHRLEIAEGAADMVSAPRIRAVREWAKRTTTGDIGEFGDPSDGDSLWPRITSTTDNCLGTECPLYDKCWVLHARREAQSADLVIANHYLLFADLTLRESGFGEVLPGADAIILDEAHKLPDIAGRFFGQAISSRQLRDMVRDARAELEALGGDMPDRRAQIDDLSQAERFWTDQLAGGAQTRSWPELASPERIDARDGLIEALAALTQGFDAIASRSEGLKNLAKRADELKTQLDTVTADDDGERVSWLEVRGSGWIWHSTPLDVASPFARAMNTMPGAWVFTSATLSVKDSLSYFCNRLGVYEAREKILASPFAYEDNALLYGPQGMPAPASPDFDAAVVAEIVALVNAAEGGAFVLCTSYRAVRAYGEALAQAGFEPLVQGQASRAALLADFRADENAILVATSSFWEGVDVRGRGLRLVIIDKLPFASPADPVLSARFSAMKAAGDNPFMDYQLPQAVITLKQGVGRLIRDAEDRGVLAICDPRLFTARYGGLVRASLPPMGVTRVRAVACEFVSELAPQRLESRA
ncbi:ATP-dependent DNA helicase [uncultured Salinisphaera sp.]|uniref:ATP-dependent DNA helicase n=1 Tax=uncultured Salinisphaera sp. TaxID=359372 RepID=UPI0032B1FE52|tara:strand:- start:1227 stop:3155 length:1929 start_codon:yes stop_codon:yes gene_type:complete